MIEDLAKPVEIVEEKPESERDPEVDPSTANRKPRNYVVRRHLIGKGSRKSKKKAVIAYKDESKQQLTQNEAEFIREVTHPASPNFLQPEKAHAAINVNDSHAGTASRVERLINKPQVAATLKELLDTPELKAKIQAGLDNILDDVTHQQYRPREWTDALRAWAELTGNKAPDKIIAIPVTPEDRNKRYEEVLARVRGEQQKLEAPVEENK